MEEKNNYPLNFKAFFSLIKYRLSLAVTFSAITGWFIYSGGNSTGLLLLATGMFFITAGSAVLNQLTEREQDAMMTRTSKRPVVTGDITVRSSLVICSLLMAAGGLLLLYTGLLPLMLGLSGILLYNIIYTSLKKKTALAVLPGALVGAVPPLIGYSAAGGNITDTRIIFFSVFMFLWQVPHFILLLIRYGKEYKNAGFKTLYDLYDVRHLNYISAAWITGSSILLSVFLLTTSTFSLQFLIIFSAITAVYLIIMITASMKNRNPGEKRVPFLLFNLYGFLVMVLLIVSSIINSI